MDFDHSYADYLTEEGITEIQALEKESGKVIMAFPSPPEPAALAPELLARIATLEKKLCVRLVAYEKF
jgi:hypothetical protein